jgi:hypothetical protein
MAIPVIVVPPLITILKLLHPFYSCSLKIVLNVAKVSVASIKPKTDGPSKTPTMISPRTNEE